MPHIVVRSLSAQSRRGKLFVGNLTLACALGRSGMSPRKREGDGATPIGRLPLRQIYHRAGRWRRNACGLPLARLSPNDGWCDAPADPNYNRHVKHPYPASAERMWREDNLYDAVVVLAHNERPRRRGLGSAIFMHLARPGYAPTEGCIALKPGDLAKVLTMVDRRSLAIIGSLTPIPAARLRRK